MLITATVHGRLQIALDADGDDFFPSKVEEEDNIDEDELPPDDAPWLLSISLPIRRT